MFCIVLLGIGFFGLVIGYWFLKKSIEVFVWNCSKDCYKKFVNLGVIVID